MNKNIIAIEAITLEEANVLNTILRIIIDGHAGSLRQFIANEDDQLLESITIIEFFKSIEECENLSIYKNFISKIPKNGNSIVLDIKGKKIRLFKSRIFNKHLIMKIINPNLNPIDNKSQNFYNQLKWVLKLK